MPDRTGDTLRELIRGCCAEGSVIQTDEWRGYSRIGNDGYISKAVNHSKKFI